MQGKLMIICHCVSDILPSLFCLSDILLSRVGLSDILVSVFCSFKERSSKDWHPILTTTFCWPRGRRPICTTRVVCCAFRLFLTNTSRSSPWGWEENVKKNATHLVCFHSICYDSRERNWTVLPRNSVTASRKPLNPLTRFCCDQYRANITPKSMLQKRIIRSVATIQASWSYSVCYHASNPYSMPLWIIVVCWHQFYFFVFCGWMNTRYVRTLHIMYIVYVYMYGKHI